MARRPRYLKKINGVTKYVRPQQGHLGTQANPRKSAALVEVEANCARCPTGHALPHHTNLGQCTPLFCAVPPAKGPKRDGPAYPGRGQSYGVAETALSSSKSAKDDRAKEKRDLISAEKRRLGYANDRRRVREEYIKVPKNLSGPEAEAYVTKRLVELTPYAVAELEYQLLYGDDRQRAEMMKEALDRTGFGVKDGGGSAVGPVLIINASGGQLNVPWAQRVPPGVTVTPTVPTSSIEVPALPPKENK